MKNERFLLLLILFFSTINLWAQPGDPGGGGNPTPITGLEILLAAGGLFGAKRLYSNRRKK